MILEDENAVTPFTHPMGDDERLAKERQAAQFMCQPAQSLNLTFQALSVQPKEFENLMSSRDSVNAVLASDLEPIETDFEESSGAKKKVVPQVRPQVSGNSNLVLNYLNDNFPHLTAKSVSNSVNECKKGQSLERKKLNQNLDNFSLRLESSLEKRKEEKIQEEIEGTNKMTPTWDSSEDAQNPPIENEEWLVFLHKTMQEILDSDLEELKQQNFVSILVAPLRNSKTSPKVVETVAQMFMLPLVINGPSAMIQEIKQIYVEVKLVPNLIFASKQLYCAHPEMTNEELKTLTCIYELVCNLVHTSSSFLYQFCDAVALLEVNDLLNSILTTTKPQSKRLKSSVLALLACVLRESPENADRIETIIFDPRLKLEDLLKDSHDSCKFRSLMLIRLLARYCCNSLQKNWSSELEKGLQDLKSDESEKIRTEAADVVEELKNLSLFNISSS